MILYNMVDVKITLFIRCCFSSSQSERKTRVENTFYYRDVFQQSWNYNMVHLAVVNLHRSIGVSGTWFRVR